MVSSQLEQIKIRVNYQLDPPLLYCYISNYLRSGNTPISFRSCQLIEDGAILTQIFDNREGQVRRADTRQSSVHLATVLLSSTSGQCPGKADTRPATPICLR